MDELEAKYRCARLKDTMPALGVRSHFIALPLHGACGARGCKVGKLGAIQKVLKLGIIE